MKKSRVFGLLFISLLTAGWIYPVLHECGHSLAALAVGGKVSCVSLFPIPYTDCILPSSTAVWQWKIVGLGGLMVPLFFTWIISIRRFWIWLVGFYLHFICLLSFCFSAISCLLFAAGRPVAGDDVTQVLERGNGQFNVWIFLFLLFLIFVTVFRLAKTQPLSYISKEISNPTPACV